MSGLSHLHHSLHRRHVHLLHTSENGLRFILRHETHKGTSEHLHWPGGSSGVTLGPGYDMKDRVASEVVEDLKAIGLKADVAEKISAAAGALGHHAEKFCHENRHLLTLTEEQQITLLRRIIPHYEEVVKRNIHTPLSQHEFDALVSFTYNPGLSIAPITNAINQGRLDEARKLILSRVITGHHKNTGLLKRRQDEVALLIHGTYHGHHAPPHLQRAVQHPKHPGTIQPSNLRHL